jgi:hypothetical protein
LLGVEIPSLNQTVGAGVRSEAESKVYVNWKELTVAWPCQSTDGKYSLLQLYANIDILEWFRDRGYREFPSVAVLASVYLGNPMSTAIQVRFFSLGGYHVSNRRTSLDDKRADLESPMKCNCQMYKTLLQDQTGSQ